MLVFKSLCISTGNYVFKVFYFETTLLRTLSFLIRTLALRKGVTKNPSILIRVFLNSLSFKKVVSKDPLIEMLRRTFWKGLSFLFPFQKTCFSFLGRGSSKDPNLLGKGFLRNFFKMCCLLSDFSKYLFWKGCFNKPFWKGCCKEHFWKKCFQGLFILKERFFSKGPHIWERRTFSWRKFP